LTILEGIRNKLPQYDYIYLGDNARAPYGTRSFDVVYEFTWQAVKNLFNRGCNLVILACNTASARALRNIQQINLPKEFPDRRVLGVIRPSVEKIGMLTQTKHVGILGTEGTIISQSYPIEIAKLYPEITVTGEACPMWVPLIENGEYNSDGADFFVKKNIESLLKKDANIDTVLLACTHYSIMMKKIRKYLPENISIVKQGDIVADSLCDYLLRHPEMNDVCTKNGHVEYFTTESPERFDKWTQMFFKEKISTQRIHLD
jgi:glutamate racemase